MIRFTLVRFLANLAVILIVLNGCAVTPKEDGTTKPGPVFYPPLPNTPRIQYLTSFSGDNELFTEQESKFARFVLGEDKDKKPGLNKPYGIAYHDGKLYTVDTRGGGYLVFDIVQKRIHTVGGMIKPINISIDSDGRKYVTDTGLNQILVFDHNDQRIQTFGRQGEFKPTDVAIAGNRLYVVDIQHQQIQVLNKATGDKLYTIGSAGSAEGQLFHPTNLAIADSGNIFVSDTGNFRVQEFTPDGRYVAKFGKIGTSFGKFARPKGVALDREGRIYVVDAAFENVQVFDEDRRLLMYFAGPGVGPGQLYLPTDITIDYAATAHFQAYAAPGFQMDYVILVTNQFGSNKVNVYGFGQMQDIKSP